MGSLDEFLAWGTVSHGWSTNTRRQYAGILTRFERWLDANGGGSLEAAPAFAYKAWLATLRPTAQSINQASKALRRWGEWLVEAGKADRSPAEKLKRLRPPHREPKPFTADEAAEVLSKAASEGGAVVVAIALQLLAGLRFTEMRTLRWESVSRDTLLVCGKGDKERRIPLHPTLRQVLAAWRLRAEPCDWIFPSPYDASRPVSEHTLRVWMAPALEGAKPHRMRATFATDVARRGGAFAVKDLLGHSSIQTADAYVRYEQTELRGVVDGLSYAI